MPWEQRKPLWPTVAALGILFILSLAASSSWQGHDWRRESNQIVSTPEIVSTPDSAGSSVADDQPAGLDIAVPSVPQPVPQLAEPVAQAQPEPLPVRREFNLDTLLYARDMLLAIVDQLPATQQRADQPVSLPKTRTPSVRVGSENDRLAMLPPRAPVPPSTGSNRSSLRQKQPAHVTDQEAVDFAAILLEAARQPARSSRPAQPRLAMLPKQSLKDNSHKGNSQPSQSGTGSVATSPVPELAEAPSPEPQVVKLPPAEPLLRHQPLALVEQLESFSADSPGAVWSQQVLSQLQQLIDRNTNRPDASATLLQLQRLYQTGIEQSQNRSHPTAHNQWQQAAQALGRRLAIWQLLLDPAQDKIVGSAQGSAHLLPVLNEVALLLEEEQNGNDWREYLLLDRLATAASEGMNTAPLKRTKLAQEVLSRMEDSRLTSAQRNFLTTSPLVALYNALRPWAAGKVNLETLAALVERYESSREMRFAAAIAQLRQRLKWSDAPRMQMLADHLDVQYRGANMRIAMSNDLLNRMIPQQKPIVTPIRDRIAGAKVRGRARTTTQLHVRLMPDADAWRFGLEAKGKVYSDTKSDTWPARVRNAAKLQYQGRKEITIDAHGLRASPAQAQAQGRNELLGVDSQLDPIPIVGQLLRGMAKKKHSKARPLALSQAKSKVVRQVKQRMDETTDQKLEVYEQKFHEKVLAPIEELALLAEPLDMHTTAQRAVMQLRLANTGQLAAHTLRPLAPSDSVLSLQMHETSLNNAMSGLGLDGQRMTMLELFEHFSQRFGQPGATPPEDMPKKAIIEFAGRDAVRVQCDEDRVELILSVTELAYRRDKIRNFQIHVHFTPALNGLDVRLVRDGNLQFSGRRLKTGPRIVLHSIIGKLLEKDQEISLVNTQLLKDPRMAGLMVTQLVIEDGWIGLALGPAHPRRTAWRSPKPSVLATPFVR